MDLGSCTSDKQSRTLKVPPRLSESRTVALSGLPPGSRSAADGDYAGWIREVQDRDRHARYFPFSLSSSVPMAAFDTPSCQRQRRTVFRNACQRATVSTFPTFSKSHPERNDPRQSVAVIVLPAISATGTLHYHGWFRIPVDAPGSYEPIQIEQNNRPIIITAPVALAAVSRHLVTGTDAPFRNGKYHTSFWLANDGTTARDDSFYPKTDKPFAYLVQRKDGERRLWDQIEFLPPLVFQRLDLFERDQA